MIKLMDTKTALRRAKLLAYQQIADRASVDLYFLCSQILGYDIIEPFAHGPLCAATRPLLFWKNKDEAKKHVFPTDFGRSEEEGMPDEAELEEFYKRTEKFIPGDTYSVKDKQEMSLHELMALMPRGTLKSSCVTIGFTIQFLLNHRDARVLIDSETFTKATAFIKEIKGHLEGNEVLREIWMAKWGVYPDQNKRSNTWSDSSLVLAHRVTSKKEPSIEASGIDVTKNGMHYDLIIFDDLHSEVNTQTKDQIDKAINHFKLAYSLLDPDCPVIVIGTRWTYTDLYQYIIDERADSFNFITRAAKSSDGELLYPGRLTITFLEKQRKGQGSYIFSCQYMNNPVDEETAKFKREWFKYKNLSEVEGLPINWYLTIDPSFEGDTSDYAAFVISGMDYQNQLYVRHILKVKRTYGQIVMLTFELYRRFQPKMIIVETLATQKSLEYSYKEKQREMGSWLPIRYVNSRQRSKEERIVALSPKYEFGEVYHIRECNQIEELEDELIHFPKAKNDDVSDAFATVLEYATPPMRGRVRTEKDEKRRARLKKLSAPRSPMIGY